MDNSKEEEKEDLKDQNDLQLSLYVLQLKI
jgi:hypothetical protein